MANTNRQNVDDNTNVQNIDPVLADAARMTFRVDNGKVMLGSDGVLFAAPEWSTVSESFKRYAVWKMLEYRLQTATGNVSDAAAKIAGDATFTPDRNCDAYESQFVGAVRGKVMARLPEGTKGTAKIEWPTGSGKERTVQQIVMDTVEAFRASQFQNVIGAAVALGNDKPSKGGEKKTRTKGTAAPMADLF